MGHCCNGSVVKVTRLLGKVSVTCVSKFTFAFGRGERMGTIVSKCNSAVIVLCLQCAAYAHRPQQYTQHAFNVETIDRCINVNRRCMFFSIGLAKAARCELLQFREFILFLRYGKSRY